MVEAVQAPPVQQVNTVRNIYIGVFLCIIASVIASLFIPIQNTIRSNSHVPSAYFYPISHMCRIDSCVIDIYNNCEKNLSYCGKLKPPSCYEYPYGLHYGIVLFITISNLAVHVVFSLDSIVTATTENKIANIMVSFTVNCIYFGIIVILYLNPFNGQNRVSPISYHGTDYMNCYDLYSALNIVQPYYDMLWKILSYGVYILGSQVLLVIIETK